MISSLDLKDSSTYQAILAEGIEKGIEKGREKGREILENVLLDRIRKQFPGLELKADLDRISDLQALEQLYFSVDQFADAEEFRARINELATKN